MVKSLLKNLANLRLAIVLLLLIALLSGIGSIIEQGKEISFYENNYSKTIFSIPWWKIFLFFGFNNIYGTWWFLFLLFILGLSLTCCTFLQQLPILKFSRRYYFYKKSTQFSKLEFKTQGLKLFEGHIGHTLISKQYSFFRQHNSLYAYKGLISRIGPIIVHFSIILILLGSTIGSLKGFNSQEIIPKTEVFHVQNTTKNGIFSSISQKTFRINDFWSVYNDTGFIKQFYSDISVLDGRGNEIKRKTISVNNPLLIKNLTLYQTDWGMLGIRVDVNNKNIKKYTLQLPIAKANEDSNRKIWVTWLPTIKKEKFFVSIRDNRGQINLYDKNGKFLRNVNLGEKIFTNTLISFNFIDFISSTGIQIKSDPGIKIIYFGFFILIVSSLVSYISFSEFWLLHSSRIIFLGGQANRAKIKFNIEFLKLKQSFYI
nr:Cytochrome c biogenesis protein [Ishige okamurae]